MGNIEPVSDKALSLGKQRLNPRAVNKTAFQLNFLFQRVLGVADLAYSLQGELISGWSIFFFKYKIKQCNQLLQRVGNAINNNSIESCF